MKLSAAQVSAFFAAPSRNCPGILIYGADAMRVAVKRQDLIAKLTGPNAEEEMRLERFLGSELRKDPARAVDAIKAQGFFPGPRAVFIEDATDGISKALQAALEEWQAGDATLVITAAALAPRSALRKLFETHKSAATIAVYDDPPSRAEIETALQSAGLKEIGRDAMADITSLASELDPGDFRQFVEKLSLYWAQETEPLSQEAIALMAPQSTEAELDDILHVVAEGRARDIQKILRRLRDQGVQPVTLCITAMRHFQTLYAIAAHPNGVSAGIGALRPPVFGPRRSKIERQASRWNLGRLEQALQVLVALDLGLRSAGQTAPAMPMVERSLIKLAMMAAR